MAAAVPRAREELTAGWVEALLREAGLLDDRARVEALEVEEIGVGRGYVGLTLRLRPTYAPAAAGPASLVAKLPTFVEMTRESDKQLIDTLYETEIAWYREFGASCPIRVPARYWSGADAGAGRFCLVLEDLGDRRQTDQVGSCDLADARLAVETLARLHAHWWHDRSLLERDWLMTSERFSDMMQPLYAQGWETFWTKLGAGLPADYEPVGTALVEQFPALVARGTSSAWTLVHGDYRLENFLFGPQGSDELCVLDWQIVSVGSGARDLAYFVSQNLLPEMRRKYEKDLLALYREGLAAGGVRDYTAERLLHDYRLGLLLATVIPVNGARFIQEQREQGSAYLNDEQRELFERALAAGEMLMKVIAERNIEAIFDNAAQDLLG